MTPTHILRGMCESWYTYERDTHSYMCYFSRQTNIYINATPTYISDTHSHIKRYVCVMSHRWTWHTLAYVTRLVCHGTHTNREALHLSGLSYMSNYLCVMAHIRTHTYDTHINRDTSYTSSHSRMWPYLCVITHIHLHMWLLVRHGTHINHDTHFYIHLLPHSSAPTNCPPTSWKKGGKKEKKHMTNCYISSAKKTN